MTQIVRILRILAGYRARARKDFFLDFVAAAFGQSVIRAPRSRFLIDTRVSPTMPSLAPVPLLATSRRTLDERERPHGTGTRLPGAHNYRARWHTTMRVSYERFTARIASRVISLSSSRRRSSFSFRLPSLSLALGSPGPSPRPLPTNSGVRMGLCPFHDDRGGALSVPSPWQSSLPSFPVPSGTHLPRIIRALAGGDIRFRSLSTVASPPRWPVFELRAKPACLSACLPSRPRVVPRMILQSNIARIPSKGTRLFPPSSTVTRALRNLPRERGKWNWMTTEIGAPLRRPPYAD